MQALQKEKRYTYADYCTWDDDTRWELIDGVPYAMAPAPSERHQTLLWNLHVHFHTFLKGKSCKVFLAPFDVRLNADSSDDTVVQPDILVVRDRSKLDGKSCNGAPDLVIEIQSPSSARHDRVRKFNAYQLAGVREYWIVDPDSRTLTVNVLENGNYIARAYDDSDTVRVRVLDGCAINLADVFAE